jgi:hypothetical protein
MEIQFAVRLGIGVVGVLLLLMARPVARRLTRRAVFHLLSGTIAAALALLAGEAALRYMGIGPTAWLMADDEPQRQPHPQLGWTLTANRVGHKTIGGRTVEYVIDRSGYRVEALDAPVNHEQPTIVFVGESVMFGEGLTWTECVPAQVGRLLNIQAANLAVHGFSTDQTYLRLKEELPRFRRPVAVVYLFMTTLFGRNLDEDRPHLGPGLVWLAPAQPSRVKSLATLLVPYRADTTVERGVAATRDALRAMVELAQARGAAPLIVVAQFGKEQEVERSLRRRILDEPGMPYALIELDEGWRLDGDQHPNARASHAMAAVVAERLRRR